MKNSERLPQPVKKFGSWISPKNNVYVVPLIIVVVMFGIGRDHTERFLPPATTSAVY